MVLFIFFEHRWQSRSTSITNFHICNNVYICDQAKFKEEEEEETHFFCHHEITARLGDLQILQTRIYTLLKCVLSLMAFRPTPSKLELSLVNSLDLMLITIPCFIAILYLLHLYIYIWMSNGSFFNYIFSWDLLITMHLTTENLLLTNDYDSPTALLRPVVWMHAKESSKAGDRSSTLLVSRQFPTTTQIIIFLAN